MKFIKLTAISAAVLASTAALAANPIVVVDNNDAVVYEAEPAMAYEAQPAMAQPAMAYEAQPAMAYEAQPVAYEAAPGYQYNSDAGVIRNTTGAVFGGTKTFFNTVTHPAAISAEVGTLGYGANIGWALNDKTELQAGWAGGDVADLFGGDFDANDINYDVDSDFSNPYMGVQLRPAGNWFTMGAGIIVPDNSIDVKANTEGGGFYRVDGKKYYAGKAGDNANADDFGGENIGALEGSIDHRNKLAPYATIGFRPNINNHWGVFGEVGAAYMGKTDATINRVAGNKDNDAAEYVANKAETDLEDKDWLEWFPIVKLGATYRF